MVRTQVGALANVQQEDQLEKVTYSDLREQELIRVVLSIVTSILRHRDLQAKGVGIHDIVPGI